MAKLDNCAALTGVPAMFVETATDAVVVPLPFGKAENDEVTGPESPVAVEASFVGLGTCVGCWIF